MLAAHVLVEVFNQVPRLELLSEKKRWNLTAEELHYIQVNWSWSADSSNVVKVRCLRAQHKT